jgi:hypothetical protein
VCVLVSVMVSSKVAQDCSPDTVEQETVVDVDVRTVVQAVRTGRAGAHKVKGISLNWSWTVAKLSR